MDKNKRIQEIEKFILAHKIATIADIANFLEVSESTARRDVEVMVQCGMVIQRHGSILSNNYKGQGSEYFWQRKSENVEKKVIIGQYAAKLIPDNAAIFVEGGTTLQEMVKQITTQNVSVVTPDLTIAMALAEKENVTTIVLGGYIWRGTYMLIGELAEQNIKKMHFTHYFTSPGAITTEGNLVYYNIQTSSIRKQAMTMAKSLIVLADSSKFGKTGFIENGTLANADVLVTDYLPDEYRPLISEKAQIIIAK